MSFPEPTTIAFDPRLSTLELAEMFRDRISKDDPYNPTTAIWLEVMFEGYLSSGPLERAEAIAKIILNDPKLHTAHLITLYSILFRFQCKIPQAIQQLETALQRGHESGITELLVKAYRGRLAGWLRTQGRIGLPEIESLRTARDLLGAWRALLNPPVQHGPSLGAASDSTPTLPASESEPEETLEDWVQTLPKRTASQEIAELQHEYKAASEALQAKIWYLDPRPIRSLGT